MASKQQNREALLPEEVIRARIRRLHLHASLRGTLVKLILILALFRLMLTVFYGIAIVPDEAMKPVLRQGDLTLFHRLDQDADVADVIVYEDDGQLRYARVAAKSGDAVDINGEGQLIVNGQAQARENRAVLLEERGTLAYPLQVREEEVFVLNDNDENTQDSRTLGPVPGSRIRGKLLMVLRRRGF